MTYNIRIYCTRMCIAVLAGAGFFGVFWETISPLVDTQMQMNVLLVTFSLALLMSLFINWFLKHPYLFWNDYQRAVEREKYYKTYPDQRESVRFKNRMSTIMRIADINMNQAKAGRGFPVRDTVIVKYEDLLKIWDIAERSRSDTPVED